MIGTVLNSTLARVRRYLTVPEAPLLFAAVLMIEMLGPHVPDDVADIPFVLVLPLLFMLGCSVVRYRHLPLTQAVVDLATGIAERMRARLVLSLGLDFHPERSPRLPPFLGLRRATLTLLLAAFVLLPAEGILHDLLAVLRVRYLYTVYSLVLGVIWAGLLAGIAVQLLAIVFTTLEVLKGRLRLHGASRIAMLSVVLTVVATLAVLLDRAVGSQGCLTVLGFACLLPFVVRPIEPPRGPWLNIALGQDARPTTARLSSVLSGIHRLMVLEAFLIVCVLQPGAGPSQFTVTDMLVRVYGWTAAWLFTGGALTAIAEFNRRRRLGDPAFDRSRVLWAIPGPEATGLESERGAIERAGWRLVVQNQMPSPEDADLLVGIPPGLALPGQVPLAKVPPSLFLLSDDPGAVLAAADESDRAQRACKAIERVLTSARPQLGERGEGTFLVPHCWLVVGLTRDDDRANLDRPPALSFGQSYQAVLGTRMRRFLAEVMERSGVDVLYIEDSVTPQQVVTVLERIFERHVRRAEPATISERDMVGLQGLRVVLHDVDPETDGLEGVDSHVTRNAISRARIMIVGRDRNDDDDDDPPREGESSDDWLRDALTRVFPRLQPVTGI